MIFVSYRLIQDGMKDKLVGFAVTEMDVNPDELLVLPVKKIDEYANYNYDLTVIIVTPEKYHSVIEKYVKEKGFHIFFNWIRRYVKLEG